MGLRRSEVSWPASFAPLVTLYPLLQSEPFQERIVPAAQQACLPHLLLLVHTFIEDHHLDQQRATSRGELLFSKQLFCDGQAMLRALAEDRRWLQATLDRAIEEYGRSELFSFSRRRPAEWPAVRRAVAGRAKLAGAAYQCLLRLAGASGEQIEAADRAFDALVVGLQWEDDLVDWRDDLATHSDNLLLWHLGNAKGEVPSAPDAVAAELSAAGIIRQAVAAARAEWQAAAELQRELGAVTLADLVEERCVRLEALGEGTLDTI
jgi:hypothetical protein